MKKVNCKKGLSALMAATMGLSMFAATGAGITNATTGKDSKSDSSSKKADENKKPKREKDIRRMFEKISFDNLKKSKTAYIRNSLIEETEEAKREAETKTNSSAELIKSLDEVHAALNSVIVRINNAKDENEIQAIMSKNLVRIEKRLREIKSIMNGERAAELNNTVTNLLDRLRVVVERLGESWEEPKTMEGIEAKLLRSVLLNMISPENMENYSFSETKLNEFAKNLSENIISRIEKLEDVINKNILYSTVKKYADELKRRINAVETTNENREIRNDIITDLDELLEKIEKERYDSLLLNNYNDQLNDLEKIIYELEPVETVEPGFIEKFVNFFKWGK